jgi:hypothetical protein
MKAAVAIKNTKNKWMIKHQCRIWSEWLVKTKELLRRMS